jgi:hypothetical protein
MQKATRGRVRTPKASRNKQARPPEGSGPIDAERAGEFSEISVTKLTMFPLLLLNSVVLVRLEVFAGYLDVARAFKSRASK